MKSLTANEAKIQFGDMLLSMQRAPVQIRKNGKPVAVVVSIDDYENIEAIKLQMLTERVHRAREEIESGIITDGEEFLDELLADNNDSYG